MSLIYTLKIAYFFAMGFILYFCARRYSYGENLLEAGTGKIVVTGLSGHKYYSTKYYYRIPVVIVILFCVAIGYYSIICGQVPFSADRGNFALRFSSDTYLDVVKNGSVGLYLLERALHLFTYNPNILFFTIAALCMGLNLIAYNYYPQANPEALLFMMLSNYCTLSFFLLKQAVAISLMGISIVAFVRKKRFTQLLFLALAILFHEAAWIIVPMYIALDNGNKTSVRVMSYLLFAVSMVFFSDITRIFVTVFNHIPGLEGQISLYLDESGSIATDSNYLTILKSFPYGIIAFVGIKKRKEIRDEIERYDAFLLMSVFSFVSIVLSGYMYWMWRFGAFCYLPSFIFASNVFRRINNHGTRTLLYLLTFLSFGLITLRALCQYYFIYGGF